MFVRSFCWHPFVGSRTMTEKTTFDDIRPYNDEEVRPTLSRLLNDNEFLDTVAQLKLPKFGKLARALVRPIVRRTLKKETEGVTTVAGFQQRLEKYVKRMLNETTAGLTVSGLEHLDPDKAYCFISNHRDIAMDPAVVNWVLYQNGFQTLRIAIGDNLLTKPFAADLMRLNKCFIVNRSASAPREKLKAAKKLSSYIHHSIVEDGANIWIAQREGRAKDGLDKTNPAIVSMLMLAKAKTEDFGAFVARANIVPVSISYELDPCDEAKARELTVVQAEGRYEKAQHEDVESIARGITQQKSHVHLAFGQPFSSELTTVEQVVEALDQAVLEQYVLHPTNVYAFEALEGKAPNLPITAAQVPYPEYRNEALRKQFDDRVAVCDPRWRDMLLRIYANPVYAKLKMMQVPC